VAVHSSDYALVTPNDPRFLGEVLVLYDADTKLIPSWCIGGRDTDTARDFIEDLAGRLANRVEAPS
jgi:hypothetical protein